MDDKMKAFLRERFATTKALDHMARLSVYNTGPVSWPRWVFEHFPKTTNQRILEIGCGNGEFWIENGENPPRESTIILTDLHVEMLRAARKAVKADPRFTFLVAHAGHLPFGGRCFDTVLANHVLHIVPDIGEAVKAIHRLLKPGGIFIFSVMSNDHMKELGDALKAFDGKYQYPGSGITRFSMESDKPGIRRLFPGMELFVYTAVLKIPDPDLITETALSIFNGIKYPDLKPHAQRFTRHVSGRMQNGVFTLTLKYGLCVCRKSVGADSSSASTLSNRRHPSHNVGQQQGG